MYPRPEVLDVPCWIQNPPIKFSNLTAYIQTHALYAATSPTDMHCCVHAGSRVGWRGGEGSTKASTRFNCATTLTTNAQVRERHREGHPQMGTCVCVCPPN